MDGFYPSIMWTTPLATSTSGWMTLALLTKILPFWMLILTDWPWVVLTESPSWSSVLYRTEVAATTASGVSGWFDCESSDVEADRDSQGCWRAVPRLDWQLRVQAF